MSIEQSKREHKVTAIPGVAVTVPGNYHPSPANSYTDAACRFVFTQKSENGTYPRVFRLLNNDSSNDVMCMFNTAGNTAANAATATLGSGTNEFTLTAVDAGSGGNSISYTGVEPATTTSTLAIAVSGTAISVSYAKSGGAITTTVDEVVALINGDTDAAALVAATTTQTGVVAAISSTNLSGGYDADSQAARSALYTAEVAKSGITVSKVFYVRAGKEKSLTLGEDVKDMTLVAAASGQSVVDIEVAYESEPN